MVCRDLCKFMQLIEEILNANFELTRNPQNKYIYIYHIQIAKFL